MPRARVVSLAASCAFVAAFVAGTPLRAQSAACDSALTQPAMNTCAGAELASAERRLAGLLAELRPRLDASRAASLAGVQRRWVAYRDAHCAWDAASFAGGSIQPMWEAQCRASLTQERIDALRLQLCEGAGMTGTCPAAGRYDRPRAERTGRR